MLTVITLRTALVYASDAPITIPLATMRRNVDDHVQAGADWWLDQVGVTFNVSTSVNPLRETWAAFAARHSNDSYKIWQALYALLVERKRFGQCDPRQMTAIILFRAPTPAVGIGGMIGVENFGCSYWRPGATGMSDWNAWALAGYPVRNDLFPVPDWRYGKWQQAVGQLLHEIDHCLDDDPTVPDDHAIDPGADLLDADHLNWPNTRIAEVKKGPLAHALSPPHIGYYGRKP